MREEASSSFFPRKSPDLRGRKKHKRGGGGEQKKTLADIGKGNTSMVKSR